MERYYYHWLRPSLVFTGVLLITVVASVQLWRMATREDQLRFENSAAAIGNTLHDRLETYVALIRGTSGVFATSDNISSQAFRSYVNRLRLKEYYPGVQGLGFATRLRPQEREAFVARLRGEGFEGFQIRPTGDRPEYFVITYLEPLDQRNLAALGFDMFSEPVRQEAMRRAVQTGSPIASGKVTLAQEIDPQKQAGFLIYAPVYQGGLVPETEAERWQRLEGFAYSPFRADDLLRGVLFNQGKEEALGLNFEIYDGEPTADHLLYRSSAEALPHLQFIKTSRLSVAGRDWTLRFATRPEFEQASNRRLAVYVFAGGLLIAVILFLLVRAQTRARREIGAATSELEQSQQALLESEDRYRTITETASDAIVTIDESGTILFVNPAAEVVFGYEVAEMMNQPLTKLMPDCQRHLREAGLKRRDGTGHGRISRESIELSGLHKDGREMPLEVSFGEFNHKGRAYFTGVIRDVTERKLAEKALRDARDQLEARVIERTRQLADANAGLLEQIHQRIKAEDAMQLLNQELQRSNRELQDFAFVASHDLQEPLRKIQAFGDLLLSQYGDKLGEEGQDFLIRMQKASQRMHTLINDLLEFSRVTTKGQPFVPVDLNKVAAEVMEDLEARLKHSGGKVEVSPLPTLEADPLQMRQLLQNLLGNALKFHGPETTPTVRLSAEAVNGKQAELRVKDNGVGFDEKYLDRIFTPFQRLHARNQYEGTGMGLAICRKIVERHGGQITAHSRLGEGTTFVITLPLSHEETERPPANKNGRPNETAN